MRGRSDHPAPLLDRAARGAARGLSRRDVLRLGAAAAVATAVPKVAWPTVGVAAKTRGTCPTAPRGTCPPGQTIGRWKPGVAAIPSGRPSVFNGCGPEAGIDIPAAGTLDPVPDRPLGLWSFFDACKAHDCCYGTCGSSQTACDSAMYMDALKVCQKARYSDDAAGMARRIDCNLIARFYWKAVSALGEKAWAAAQESACLSCEECDADLMTDRDNCGTCGEACHPGFICCDGVCKDPAVDNENCGGCGNRCTGDTRCIAGTCTKKCPRGTTPCGDRCCPDGKVCRDGACVDPGTCDPGQEECGGECCRPGRPCVDGVCGKWCGNGRDVKCGATQECCWTVLTDDSSVVCCPKGTGCSYNYLALTGECV